MHDVIYEVGVFYPPYSVGPNGPFILTDKADLDVLIAEHVASGWVVCSLRRIESDTVSEVN